MLGRTRRLASSKAFVAVTAGSVLRDVEQAGAGRRLTGSSWPLLGRTHDDGQVVQGQGQGWGSRGFRHGFASHQLTSIHPPLHLFAAPCPVRLRDHRLREVGSVGDLAGPLVAHVQEPSDVGAVQRRRCIPVGRAAMLSIGRLKLDSRSATLVRYSTSSVETDAWFA